MAGFVLKEPMERGRRNSLVRAADAVEVGDESGLRKVLNEVLVMRDDHHLEVALEPMVLSQTVNTSEKELA